MVSARSVSECPEWIGLVSNGARTRALSESWSLCSHRPGWRPAGHDATLPVPQDRLHPRRSSLSWADTCECAKSFRFPGDRDLGWTVDRAIPPGKDGSRDRERRGSYSFTVPCFILLASHKRRSQFCRALCGRTRLRSLECSPGPELAVSLDCLEGSMEALPGTPSRG